MEQLNLNQNEEPIREVITLTGRPRKIDFARKRRRVIRAFATDEDTVVTRVGDVVFMNGPKDATVLIDYVPA